MSPAAPSRHPLLPLTFALVLVSGGAIGCSSEADPSAAEPVARAERKLKGQDEYEKAKAAIMAGNTRDAKLYLEEATRRDAQICEYWYQLGAVESNLAIEVVNQSESEALSLFGDSVDHKR